MNHYIKQFLKIFLILMLVVNINQISYTSYAENNDTNVEGDEIGPDDDAEDKANVEINLDKTLSYGDAAEPGDFSQLTNSQQKAIKNHVKAVHDLGGIVRTEVIYTKGSNIGNVITFLHYGPNELDKPVVDHRRLMDDNSLSKISHGYLPNTLGNHHSWNKDSIKLYEKEENSGRLSRYAAVNNASDKYHYGKVLDHLKKSDARFVLNGSAITVREVVEVLNNGERTTGYQGKYTKENIVNRLLGQGSGEVKDIYVVATQKYGDDKKDIHILNFNKNGIFDNDLFKGENGEHNTYVQSLTRRTLYKEKYVKDLAKDYTKGRKIDPLVDLGLTNDIVAAAKSIAKQSSSKGYMVVNSLSTSTRSSILNAQTALQKLINGSKSAEDKKALKKVEWTLLTTDQAKIRAKKMVDYLVKGVVLNLSTDQKYTLDANGNLFDPARKQIDKGIQEDIEKNFIKEYNKISDDIGDNQKKALANGVDDELFKKFQSEVEAFYGIGGGMQLVSPTLKSSIIALYNIEEKLKNIVTKKIDQQIQTSLNSITIDKINSVPIANLRILSLLKKDALTEKVQNFFEKNMSNYSKNGGLLNLAQSLLSKEERKEMISNLEKKKLEEALGILNGYYTYLGGHNPYSKTNIIGNVAELINIFGSTNSAFDNIDQTLRDEAKKRLAETLQQKSDRRKREKINQQDVPEIIINKTSLDLDSLKNIQEALDSKNLKDTLDRKLLILDMKRIILLINQNRITEMFKNRDITVKDAKSQIRALQQKFHSDTNQLLKGNDSNVIIPKLNDLLEQMKKKDKGKKLKDIIRGERSDDEYNIDERVQLKKIDDEIKKLKNVENQAKKTYKIVSKWEKSTQNIKDADVSQVANVLRDLYSHFKVAGTEYESGDNLTGPSMFNSIENSIKHILYVRQEEAAEKKPAEKKPAEKKPAERARRAKESNAQQAQRARKDKSISLVQESLKKKGISKPIINKKSIVTKLDKSTKSRSTLESKTKFKWYNPTTWFEDTPTAEKLDDRKTVTKSKKSSRKFKQDKLTQSEIEDKDQSQEEDEQ